MAADLVMDPNVWDGNKIYSDLKILYASTEFVPTIIERMTHYVRGKLGEIRFCFSRAIREKNYEFAEFIFKNFGIDHLNSYTAESIEDWQRILDLCRSQPGICLALEELEFNPMRPTRKGLDIISEILKYVTSKDVQISGVDDETPVTDDAWVIQCIQNLSINCHHPKCLHLCHLNFTMVGLRVLGEFLLKFPTIKYLDISGNPIGDEGLQFLTELVPRLPHLVFLDIGDIGVTPDAIKYIVDLIRLNQLSNLDACNAGFTWNEAIFSAMAASSVLDDLRICPEDPGDGSDEFYFLEEDVSTDYVKSRKVLGKQTYFGNSKK